MSRACSRGWLLAAVAALAACQRNAPSSAPAAIETPAPAAPAPLPAPSGTQINSREDAFEMLLRIAAYFRRTEPHSPIAHSLETLVRRGRLDFLALIEELIPDETTRQSVMKTAGIQARPGGQR